MTIGTSRHALILPIVLVVVGLLALVMAGFMFFVNAEVSGFQAQRDGQQARLAAESGLQEVIAVLREEPNDPTAWYDVPEKFRHALVWSPYFKRDEDPVRRSGSRTEILKTANPQVAWRYSVVADNLDGRVDTMRYGVTPEASKLNLNAATPEEIEALLTPVLLEGGFQNAPELIAALLDWLDADSEVTPGGVEDEYYTNLNPGYHAKNGKLDSLEELLLVKGWSAAMLYGEDVNRNGILDGNEDDGAETFPTYDNADGVLYRGLAPYVTIWSREPRSSSGQSQDPNQTQNPGTGTLTGDPNSPGGKQPGRSQDVSPQGTGDDQDPNGTPAGATGASGDDPNTTGSTGTGQGQSQTVEGLIDVNTASLRVLRALLEAHGQAPELADRIVAQRQEMTGDALAEPDWVVTTGAMDQVAYDAIKDRLTTRALQFHVEILGYADHIKLARRYEWVIEMRGKVAQVLYYRDLTGLGLAWPIDDDNALAKGR
jgi:type II secretory pathway component PulK